MAQPITMPKFGQTVEESTLVKWHKREGDPVAQGDILFEIETDKATLEVESFFEGTLLKILVKEGETVPVQALVGYVGEPGEKIPDTPPPAPAPAPVEKAPAAAAVPAASSTAPAPTPARATAAVAAPFAPPVPAPATAAPERLRLSPRARKLARESVIDAAHVMGTGPGGRIVERDVRAYLDANHYDALRVSPAAKRLAAAEQIDLLSVSASGDAGRIVVQDVERAAAEKPQPLSKMRRVIARRLTESFMSTPHIYVTVSADMTDLMAFRQDLKSEGKAFTVTDFIMEAVILALKEFPAVNSTCDGQSVFWHSKVQLGLAVSLEQGLVVPVVRDAEDLPLPELHDRARALAGKAREGKLLPDEMSGSTFTISNMGMLDVENFCAIINPGESAILAVSSTLPQPVVRDGKVAVRSMMKLTLSADHRIVDGAMAAAFVNSLKSKLEDVELWKLLT